MTLDLEILACGAIFVLLAYGLYEFLLQRKSYFAKKKYEAQYKKSDDYDQKSAKSTKADNSAKNQTKSGQQPNANSKSGKKSQLKKRGDKTNYSHSWLLTSLKGHTGTSVLDMEFSANGKYLATCADDPTSILQIDGEISDVTNETSTSSEDSPKQKRAANRNKNRNRNRNNATNKATKPKVPSPANPAVHLPPVEHIENAETARFRAIEPPLRIRSKLNLSEYQLISFLKNYLLDENLMTRLGFPTEYRFAANYAVIYKYPQYQFSTFKNDLKVQQTNNVFYYMNTAESIIVNENDGLVKNFGSEVNDSDSGQGSGSSSPSVEGEYDAVPTDNKQATGGAYLGVTSEKECVRCGKGFFVSNTGDYLTHENCSYHWGKKYRSYDGNRLNITYSCCSKNDDGGNNGCSVNKAHVWNGLALGVNGPIEGYVSTQPRCYMPADGNTGIFALDCEMCYTGCGLELTKVSIIRSDGRLYYQSLVKPERPIVDYNTRFSGITESDLKGNSSRRVSINCHNSTNKSVKSLREVQNDILKFIHSDTILIGHSIENDLRALKLIHKTVIDTSIMFPHQYGLPYRRSLKSLAQTILKREIQTSESGHDSYEDSRATLEILLSQLKKDFRTVLHQT